MRGSNHGSFVRKLLGICLTGIAVVLFAIVLLLAPNQPLTSTICACTPPPDGHPVYSVAERTNAAEVVLEGTVTEIDGDFYPIFVTVIVDRYFKNRGPETVTITNLGASSLCQSSVFVGQEGIFYTKGNPDIELSANYLSAHDAIDPATAAVAAQVIATVGHDPVPPYVYRLYLPIYQATE